MKDDKGKGLIVAIAISIFLMGFVAGMFVMYFSSAKSSKNASEDDTSTTINIEGEEIKVYVPKREIRYGEIPVNSYDTEKFIIGDDGYMAYIDDNGNKLSHLGVDISYHQESVDWNQLKESPCEFVMLRCGYRGYTEGGLLEDSKFREYADAATLAGIPMGVYFFTQALTEEEAIEEADFAMSLIEDYSLSYPLAIDTEYVSDEDARTNKTELSKEERTKCVVAFCERVKEFGYYPIVYASENWLRRSLDAEMLQEYEIWAPQYLDENDFMYDFTVWQYTDGGTIPGIDGVVDLNISMVDYASFVPDLRKAYLTDGEIIEVEE